MIKWGHRSLFVLCFFLFIPRIAFPQDVKLTATVGFGGKFFSCNANFSAGCAYVPVYATLQNGGQAIEGTLSVRLEEKYLRRAIDPPYSRHVSLAPDEKKKVTLYVPLKNWSSSQDTVLIFTTANFSVRKKLRMEMVQASEYYSSRISDESYYPQWGLMLMAGDDVASYLGQKVMDFMVNVQPEHIPELFAAIPARVPFITDIQRFSALKAKQSEAVFDWVRLGGDLFFLTKNRESIKALLPQDVTWKSAFEKFELGFGTIRVKPLSSLPKTPASEKGVPSVLKTFVSSDSKIPFSSAGQYGGSDFQLNKIPQLRLPSSGGVFWLVFAYAFLMGPVLFSILRKKTHEERAWKLIPVISFLCFSFFVFLGTRGKGERSAKLHCLMVFFEGETKGQFRCEAGLYSPSHGHAELNLAHNVAAYDLVAMRNYEPVFSLSADQYDDEWKVQTRWLARTMRVFSLLGTVNVHEKANLDAARMASALKLKTWSSKLSEKDAQVVKFFSNNLPRINIVSFAGGIRNKQLGISKSPFNEAHIVVVLVPKAKSK